MSAITGHSTLLEVAALVSEALQNAGIAATLSGGSAVSIYTENAYQSRDLDFVTAALVDDLVPVLMPLGFRHELIPRNSLFEHPLIDWYLDFQPSPLAFGKFSIDHRDCGVIAATVGQLRVITPTQSVMDRLAAVIAWNDPQSREQAILVAANNDVDWGAVERWLANEGEPAAVFERFQKAVDAAKRA